MTDVIPPIPEVPPALREAAQLGKLIPFVFHLFIDFSSVVVALIVVFLPESLITSVAGILGRGLPRTALGMWFMGSATVLASGIVGQPMSIFAGGRLLLSYVLNVTCFLSIVVSTTFRKERTLTTGSLWPMSTHRWLLLVPVLTLLVGLGPYLELRTAASFNMYSNLAVVNGRSNHLILRSSLRIGARHSNAITILSSSDNGLARYIDSGYEIPWDSFRSYMANHPKIAVRFSRGDREISITSPLDDPAAFVPPPLLIQKMLPLRAIDMNDSSRCQDNYLPAL